MNGQTQTYSGEPPPVITIHSHYPGHYHEVMVDAKVLVAVYCPWPKSPTPPTEDQQEYILDQSQSITRYLMSEGFLENPEGKVFAAEVFTKHSSIQN